MSDMRFGGERLPGPIVPMGDTHPAPVDLGGGGIGDTVSASADHPTPPPERPTPRESSIGDEHTSRDKPHELTPTTGMSDEPRSHDTPRKVVSVVTPPPEGAAPDASDSPSQPIEAPASGTEDVSPPTADEYYRRIADNQRIPPEWRSTVLDGQHHPLVEPDTTIPITEQTKESPEYHKVQQGYKDVVKDMAGYGYGVVSAAQPEKWTGIDIHRPVPNPGEKQPKQVDGKWQMADVTPDMIEPHKRSEKVLDRHIRTDLPDMLIPSGATAGELQNIRIQVVVPSDVDPELVGKALRNSIERRYDKQPRDYDVFAQVSADYVTDEATASQFVGTTSGLIIVTQEPTAPGVGEQKIALRVYGASHPANAELADKARDIMANTTPEMAEHIRAEREAAKILEQKQRLVAGVGQLIARKQFEQDVEWLKRTKLF